MMVARVQFSPRTTPPIPCWSQEEIQREKENKVGRKGMFVAGHRPGIMCVLRQEQARGLTDDTLERGAVTEVPDDLPPDSSRAAMSCCCGCSLCLKVAGSCGTSTGNAARPTIPVFPSARLKLLALSVVAEAPSTNSANDSAFCTRRSFLRSLFFSSSPSDGSSCGRHFFHPFFVMEPLLLSA